MGIVQCILQGLLTGLILSLMLGTVFFSLIRNSISSGYKTGIYIASGVILCDIVFISLALLSSDFAGFLKEYGKFIAIGGGTLLILMGIVMFIRSKPENTEGKAFVSGSKNIWYYIGNGFLLNVLNPVNFFSWLAISIFLKAEYDYGKGMQSLYFASSLFSIFCAEIGIAYFAALLKKWMTTIVVQRINQVSGLIFIGLGLRLILLNL